MEHRIINSSTVTLGYSDTEDRLWIRILNKDGTDKKMWLTRNLCEKICICLVSNLEKTLSPNSEKNSKPSKNMAKILATEHQVALEEATKKKPNDSVEAVKPKYNSPIRLCSSVNIQFGKAWKLQFFCAEEANSFEIKTDRKNIHQILSAIIKQCAQANWNIENLPKWGL